MLCTGALGNVACQHKNIAAKLQKLQLGIILSFPQRGAHLLLADLSLSLTGQRDGLQLAGWAQL